MNQMPMRFDGSDIHQLRDGVRLTGQLERIMNCLNLGSWWTLNQLMQQTGDPPASISAQLRNLRKERFGGHVIEKRYVDSGLYEYRLVR